MPIYLYQCGICGREDEVIHSIFGSKPLCCTEAMRNLPTAPALIEIKGKRSEGYKKGYAKEYRRRLGKE